MTGVAGERARKRTCAPGSEMRRIGKGEPPGKGGSTADGNRDFSVFFWGEGTPLISAVDARKAPASPNGHGLRPPSVAAGAQGAFPSPQAPHPSPNALFQRGHRPCGKYLSKGMCRLIEKLVLTGPKESGGVTVSFHFSDKSALGEGEGAGGGGKPSRASRGGSPSPGKTF